MHYLSYNNKNNKCYNEDWSILFEWLCSLFKENEAKIQQLGPEHI